MPIRAPFLAQLSSEQRRAVALLFVLMLLAALTEGFGLLLLVPMLGVLGGAGEGNAFPGWLAGLALPLSLPVLLGLFVLLVLLRSLVTYALTISRHKFEIAVVDGMRERAWSALLHCDWRQLAQMHQSDNASLLISNVDRVGYGIDSALRALAQIVTLAGLGLAALAISPLIALAALAAGLLLLLAYRGMRRRASLLGDALDAAWRRVHASVSESLGALRVIKSFEREDRAIETGFSAFSGLRATQLAFMRDAGRAQIFLHTGGALVLAVLVWLAIGRWGAGPAEVLPLVALFARALPLLAALQGTLHDWAHAQPAYGSAMALIETAEAAREPAPPPGLVAPALKQRIVLDSVGVTYSGRDRPALAGLNVEFPAGSVTAIAGPSGAGKSTLADLLAGLIAPDSGNVSVDGVALDGPLRRAWRQRVAYVQQEPILFSGTIRENLLWADPAADEARIAAALRDAAAEFALTLPDGLDSRIGESGRQLSGGERQRIVLARALLRDPALLILDEAASALDPGNEAEIARAVGALRGRLTVVIIGHKGKLGTIADRVVTLEGGRIVEQGR